VSIVDPFDVLREHLRSQFVPDPITSVEALVDDIFSGAIRPPDLRRRRGRRAFGFGAGALLIVTGGVAAANLIRRDHVTKPEIGVVCRAEANRQSNLTDIGIQADPVGACRAQWESGEMNRVRDGLDNGAPVDPSDISVPYLVACVSQTGVLEVFPVDPGDTCEAVDLAPVPPTTAGVDPLVALQERIVWEINGHCVSPADAPARIEQMLADLGLEGWTIQVGTERPDEPCSRVGFDAELRTVFVVHGPIPEETLPYSTDP